jgi:hypothetical protein
MYMCQGLVLIEPGETTHDECRHRTHECRFGMEHGNKENTEHTLEALTDVIVKTEMLFALSAVGSATSMEELRQADAAYEKALCTARSMGYRPHIRAADGHQIQVEWVALGEATFCEGHANIARQSPMTSKREGG